MAPSSFFRFSPSKRGSIGAHLKMQAKNIVLEPSHKARIRQQLTIFISQNPPQRGTGLYEGGASLVSSVTSFVFRPIPGAVVVVMVLVLSTSGPIAYAANDALPDEVLYSVKIQMNERLERLFALNDDARADLAARHAERRLEEAALLAAQQRLTQDVRTRIAAQFDLHIARLTQLGQQLGADGHVEAAANIQTRIESISEIHSQILASIEENDIPDSNEIALLREHLASSAQVAQRMQEATREDQPGEDEAESQYYAAAMRSQAQATERLEKSIAYYQEYEPQLTARAQTSARHELGLAQDALTRGNEYVRNEQFSEAISAFAQSVGYSTRATSIIRSSLALAPYLPDDQQRAEEIPSLVR